MKKLYTVIIPLLLFFTTDIASAQVVTLGTASNFVLFTTTGAITNSGTGFLTHLTGKVGSNSGSSTGFGNVDGTMHSGDPVTAAATSDVTIAYNQLNTAIPTSFPSSSLGNGTTLVAGVYSIPTAATLSSTLILDAQGSPGAVFIFQINGALSTSTNAKIKIINGGLACNVYWKVEGLVSIAAGNSLKGTIIAHNAAIAFGTQDTLEGRALSMNGAITLNSLTAATPIGCGSPLLTGPVAPTFGAVGSYALFSSIGPVTNSGAITYVTGDIGTNLGLTTGYNPLYVNGTIHPVPDGSTAAAATALSVTYAQLNALPTDIELLYPAIFGHNLVLTPHTYLLNAATSLTDTIYLDAQGNSNAVFVLKVNGAFSTVAGAVIKLINGTQSRNVYWKVEGAVNLANNTTFHGNIIANNGAIDITAGAKFYGRALTTTGAITTSGDSINGLVLPYTGTINGDSTVCIGSSIPLTGVDTGGVWSVTNSRASITNAGILTGLSAGIDTVKYAITNVFGTTTATKIITIKPLANAGTISGPSNVCIGAPITFTNTMPGGVWTISNARATIANGLVTGITPGIDTIIYTVTTTCGTALTTRIITINQTPDVAASANQTLCNGTLTAPVNFTGTVSGTSFSWTNNNVTIGLTGSGNGNIPAFTALNGTNAFTTGTITVTPAANGCTGAAKNFTITVRPTPGTATVPDQSVCNGTATTAVVYTGSVSGTTFTWVNDNTSIGLASSGAGNIASFTALNNTNAPAIANINVTPAANGCSGALESFTITVNPTPNVTAVADQIVCNGSSTTLVTYTGAVNGTTFAWTNDNATIGLANAGTGDIAPFTAINVTNTPALATIKVTPSANACTGAFKSFTITVNPTPNVAVVANQAICSGAATNVVNYSGTVNGTTFAWTNNNPTIGLAGSGNGSIPSFIGINNMDTPIVATITVTPSANGCEGISRTFTITVNNNPTAPVITLGTAPSVCDMVYFRNFGAATLPPAGINYSWSTINASISDTGNTQQYALVNFKKVGMATVILTATNKATGCINTGKYNVEVNTNIADVPAQVIYFNKSFVCLQNNEEAYAWGYDDAKTLAPTWIKGEMNQDYVNATPDFTAYNYWVMVTHNGCDQKTYYNVPPDASMNKMNPIVTVFPNPADQQITIAVNATVAGTLRVEIYNMLGNKMSETSETTNTVSVNIASFPSGIYTVMCYLNNEKISTKRVTRN